MQQPTCTNVRIRSTQDAHKIFYAVQKGLLPMVTRRLDANERNALTTGCVYAWEERCSQNEITGLGIERFTEGRRWSPSRVRDEFLFYYEKYQVNPENGNSSTDLTPPRGWDPMVKQTYSVWVDTEKGRRKWHLTAYFTQTTVDDLGTIDSVPELKDLEVPAGLYKSTRVNKKRNKADGENPNANGDHSSKSTAVSRTYAPFSPLYNPYPSTGATATPAPDSVMMHDPYQRDNSPSYMAGPAPDRRSSFTHGPESFVSMPYEEHGYHSQYNHQQHHHQGPSSRGDTYSPVPAVSGIASSSLTASPPEQFYHHPSRYAEPSSASTWGQSGNGIMPQESLAGGEGEGGGGGPHHTPRLNRSPPYHAQSGSPSGSFSPYTLMSNSQHDPYNSYHNEAYTTPEGSRTDGSMHPSYTLHDEPSPQAGAFLTSGPAPFELLVRPTGHDERRASIGPDRNLASIEVLTRRHPYRRDPLDDQTLRMLPP